MATERDDANGPYVLWDNYGYEGWKPRSFDTVQEALRADRYGHEWRITKVVEFKVVALP